ncbi:DNA ligase D [Bdellovibrio sp. SKB1291214]|uniref:DNA ligase D n=1 Tax=Bdellovibrio sp. SKB1291214 TaxID=1732569 RepID=UPI0022407481|nr:DNA ligase D [Bdellovibrio sp. SKB1291214]UYL07251.1 DNA ligase D [Bdellovibrio sp. SKB1291214]
MPLTKYNKMRDFSITKEPKGIQKKSKKGALSFVVQEHHASHLHWDFRLEWEGVLKSWAVPKGPSMDPHTKRLAVETEDHPLSYGSFHGTIPEDQYGGGEVYIWDKGTWEPLEDAGRGFKKGHLVFNLKGKKLKGVFHLVRTRGQGRQNQWLLMKKDDAYAEAVPDIELVAPKKSTRPKAAAKSTAVKKKIPTKSKKIQRLPFITPELALLVDEPPEGPEWLHELKFDGYRVQAHVYGEDVALYTRSGQNWTDKFPSIAQGLTKLNLEGAVLDGEIVILDEQGRSDFQLLQNALKANNTRNMFFYAFDLLAIAGKDLRSLTLEQRKDELQKLIKKSVPQIRYSGEFEGTGKSLLALAKKHGLEGIISKKRESPYRSERNSNWLKIKCSSQQEFVIAGYTDSKGSRDHFGALLLGIYKNDKLQYVGKVGTGFTQQSLRDVFKTLKPLEIKTSPFDLKSPRGKDIHWLKPKYSAEITFANWTHEEILRVPVFHGLREDKPTKQIKKETPAMLPSSKEDWSISSPEKILFPKEKITKKDVATFYSKIAKHIIPLVTDRPLSLVRCPNGTGKQCFFQKHQAKIPESMTPVKLKEHGGYGTYMSIHDDAGLAALVQMNAFEIHCSNSRHPQTDVPDQFVMDFDPGPGVSWKAVVDSAFTLRKLLEGLSLKSFVKLSGGKGVHVHVPISPQYTFDQINSFTHALALQMEQQDPDLYVSKMSKKIREGRIFVDYLRNSQGATAVAPYSLRAREVSAVAMPITWNDLKKIPSGNFYDLKKALAHLQRRRSDPWQGYGKLKQRIPLLEKTTTKKSSTRAQAHA